VGSRLTIPTPSDYRFARDVCSYGYFLLAPNHWDPRTRVFSRVLDLTGGEAGVAIRERQRGTIEAKFSRTLDNRDRAEARRQIARMLRLDEPTSVIREFHRLAPRWRRSGRGRLMRSPTLFEDVIKTVTSCNVTWPSTIVMNRRLCEVVGRGGAFPTPRLLARARPTTLRARCRVGYRDARIIEIARLFHLGKVNEEWLADPATPDDDVWEALLEWPGIGPYAAANIMQLLGRYSRLPLDSESLRHGKAVMGLKGSDRQIMRAVHEHFAPLGSHAFRGYWFELWEFYEARRGKSWTWERDKTGSTFTASQLK
jgi:3-methyladenine DNA glycosylase/8-oxoguanine DNA glycosylase